MTRYWASEDSEKSRKNDGYGSSNVESDKACVDENTGAQTRT